MVPLIVFLVYSAFCFWVIALDGAEVLEGWGAFALFGLLAAALTPSELKFYVGISWIAGLVMLLITLFAGTGGS